MPKPQEEKVVVPPFVIRRFAASDRWAVYTDGQDIDDRIDQGEFGDEAYKLFQAVYEGEDYAVEAAQRLAEIVKPALSSPFGTGRDAEGRWVVTMTYAGYKAFCGHINASQAAKVADKAYETQAVAQEAAKRLHTLLIALEEEAKEG